jgi:hypothetical protein
MQNHSSRPKRPRDAIQLGKIIVDLATGQVPVAPDQPLRRT